MTVRVNKRTAAVLRQLAKEADVTLNALTAAILDEACAAHTAATEKDKEDDKED